MDPERFSGESIGGNKNEGKKGRKGGRQNRSSFHAEIEGLRMFCLANRCFFVSATLSLSDAPKHFFHPGRILLAANK